MAKSKFEERFKLPAGFEKDLDSRIKITKAIDKFFKLKKLKRPESYLEKRGKDYRTGKREKDYYGKLITSKRREGGKQPHRKFGAIDIAAGVLGPHQEDFINFMLKEGFRVIDERNAVSQSGHFRRGIFHIDDHPTEKGWLRKEIPQKWKEGDRGKKVAIDGEWWRLNPKSGTGGYRVVKKPKKEEIKESIKVEDKFQIPTDRSKIPAWMKKHGWKSKDIGKMVDGKWVGYHPGDVIKRPKEQITGTAKETVTDKDLEHFNQPEVGDVQNTPPVEMKEEESLKIQQEGSAVPFVKEKVEEKFEEEIPEPTPEIPPQQMPLDQPTPYGVYAKGQPEFIAAEKEQIKMAKDGGLMEAEESEEEIFPKPVVDLPDLPKGKTVTGKEPLTPEQLETQQEEPGDTAKMSIPEVQERLKETLEVTSEPGSDVVKLTTRPSQVKKRKALKEALVEKKRLVEAGPPDEPGILEAQKLGITDPSQQVKESVSQKITEKAAQPPVDVEPKAFDLQSFIQQTMQRDDEAHRIMNEQLAAAADVENKIQKVEPYRFWNNMSTPAKIVAGIGMLVGAYSAKDTPSGLQAVMNVIDGAVNADIQAQKLTQQQQLVVAKEATRRAKAAVDRYKATATSPQTKAKLLELAQALEVKRAGIAKKQQLQHLRGYVMNQAREGRLHLVPPSLMRMVYPKEDMKRIDTMRTNYEKERKERKIQPVLSAYRRMHNLISRDEEISGMDDIAIVFSFMKLLDPGSVVRESEFETAANAGPRAKYFARQWNRFITGGRFTQADRRGFLRSALTLVKPALDEEKQLQKKYISMSRRYGYPAAFIIPPSTRYFDLPGTMDEAAIRKIMKERGKTYEEAYAIHNQVAKRQAAKPRVSRATKHRQKMGF